MREFNQIIPQVVELLCSALGSQFQGVILMYDKVSLLDYLYYDMQTQTYIKKIKQDYLLRMYILKTRLSELDTLDINTMRIYGMEYLILRYMNTGMVIAMVIAQATAIALANDGNIMGIPITANDIRRAYDIYGKPVAAVRGMSTKKKVSSAAPDDTLKSDQSGARGGEGQQQWLYTDIFYVRQLPFLVSLVSPLDLIVVVNQLKSPRPETVTNIGMALQNQLTVIRAHGYMPTRVFADPCWSVCRCSVGHLRSW